MLGMVRGLCGLAIAAAAILSMVAPGAAQEGPSGTVEISSRTIALGFGFNRGDGVLTLRDGSKHNFSVENITFGAVGGSVVRATGAVYNLKRLKDFDGNYLDAEAGLVIGGGISAMTMKNEQGVIMNLFATQWGVNFTLGFGTMFIRVKSDLF